MVDVGVEGLGGFGEERVFCGEQVCDSVGAVGAFLFQRAFQYDIGAKCVEADFTSVAFLVSVAGGDVHDR